MGSEMQPHSKKSRVDSTRMRVDSTRTCGTRILPRCVSNQHVIFYCAQIMRAQKSEKILIFEIDKNA
jgi:hypothetical protein